MKKRSILLQTCMKHVKFMEHLWVDCKKWAFKSGMVLKVSHILFQEEIAVTWSWSESISPRTDSAFGGQCLSVMHCPPTWNLKQVATNKTIPISGPSDQPQKRKTRKVYIFSDGTHTQVTGLVLDVIVQVEWVASKPPIVVQFWKFHLVGESQQGEVETGKLHGHHAP